MADDPSTTPPEELTTHLAGAHTVTAAADVVVHHLQAHGIPLPSVYLELAGRLRCHAQRGYWQILDGIPCDLGIMARAYRTGRTVEVSDATQEEEYLFAAPDLQRQISVPVRHRGRVVGTVNAESRSPFPAGTRPVVEQVAAAFEHRLEELGGPPAESLAQRVARLATGLSQLGEESAIHAAALDAALQIADMATAALVERDGRDRARVVAGVGPLAAALSDVDPYDLAQLDAWVGTGSSLHASGTAASDLGMHGHLRDIGVAALAVVPLTAAGEHLGCLVVASGTPQTLTPVVLPSLEILAAQTAASIRTIRFMAALQRRARQDPLTELGHHATFHEDLRAVLGDRRLGDRHVAVLLIDVDGFKAINDQRGHQAGDRVLRQLSATLMATLRTEDRLYRIGGDEFATILAVHELDEAEDVARRMVEAAHDGPTTVSIGVAMAGDGSTADELVAEADRAMYAAKRAGRDTVGVAARTVSRP